MVKLKLIVVTLAILLIFGPASAWAADWRLREVSGGVRVAVPARAIAPGVAGQVLPIGTSITTGGNGRAVITNGDQRIVVGPNSRTTLAQEQRGMTRILQDLGSALFQVDRQRQQHFRVETPLLAAVVKGTTFTVSVDPQGDRVHVSEGLVEVRAISGNAGGDVIAGATGVVSRTQPDSVEITAPSASVALEGPVVALTPIDFKEVTGGLVENPPVTLAALPAAPSAPVSPAPAPAPTTPGPTGGNAGSAGGTNASSGTNGSGGSTGTGSAGPSAGTNSGGSGIGGSASSGNGGGNSGGATPPGTPGGGAGPGTPGNGGSGPGTPGGPGNSGGNSGGGNGGGNGGSGPGTPGGPGNSGGSGGGGNGGGGPRP